LHIGLSATEWFVLMSDLAEIHGASLLGPSGEVTLEEGHSHGSSKICTLTKLVKFRKRSLQK